MYHDLSVNYFNLQDLENDLHPPLLLRFSSTKLDDATKEAINPREH